MLNNHVAQVYLSELTQGMKELAHSKLAQLPGDLKDKASLLQNVSLVCTWRDPIPLVGEYGSTEAFDKYLWLNR